jgi:hypothetical protein
MDGCEFCTRCTKEFGNKGALPFGYYDQDKPEEDLVTGKKLPWKTLEDFKDTEKKPNMKVGEIREKLEEMGLDTSGKKAELLERLEAALEAEEQHPVDVVEETPKKKKKKMIKKVKKNQDTVPVLQEKPVEKPVENLRNVEEIVAKNGQVLNLDLGPADPAAGTGTVKEDPDETVEIEENEQVESPIPETPGKVEEEDEEEEDEDEEEEEEGDDDFDADDFEEIEFEDVDYLYDENSNKVYTMDGVHVGSWDEDEGINWNNDPHSLKIKAKNHPE